MKLSLAAVFCSLGAASVAPAVYGWGAAGHEIVATIAQMYLHPKVMPILCDILNMPPHNCHLAPIASWADRNRMRMRWSASLHYVGALDDHPSDSCAFPGDNKWAGKESVNVLDGIRNTTALLQSWVERDQSDATANEALKFLVHFVGDVHQPLHLTGRERGGNGIKVLFDRRHTNLHSVWDTLLLAQAIRTVPRNYTHPLPYPGIERNLRGTIYDAYIRRIMFEGVLHPWKDDLPTWLTCPDIPEPEVSQIDLSATSLNIFERTFTYTLKQAQNLFDAFDPRMGVEIQPDGPIVCPYFWAQPNHKLNCDIIWPKELDQEPYKSASRMSYSDSKSLAAEKEHMHGDSEHLDVELVMNDRDESNSFDGKNDEGLIQLDTPEYAGEVAKRMILEKMLAQGGVRLAGLLNYIFAPQDEVDGLYVSVIA